LANTLAYYDTATITAVKSFIIQTSDNRQNWDDTEQKIIELFWCFIMMSVEKSKLTNPVPKKC